MALNCNDRRVHTLPILKSGPVYPRRWNSASRARETKEEEGKKKGKKRKKGRKSKEEEAGGRRSPRRETYY